MAYFLEAFAALPAFFGAGFFVAVFFDDAMSSSFLFGLLFSQDQIDPVKSF